MQIMRTEDQIDLMIFLQNQIDDVFFLRHAAADREDQIGIFPLHPLQRPQLTDDLIFSVFPHRARVQENQIGVRFRRRRRKAHRFKNTGDRLRIAFIRLTTIGMNIITPADAQTARLRIQGKQ